MVKSNFKNDTTQRETIQLIGFSRGGETLNSIHNTTQPIFLVHF